MARRKKAVCFIDDQEDELTRFREQMGERFTIGAGTSIENALEELKAHGASKPDLFLVDLYGSEGPSDVDNPIELLSRARAELLVAETNFYQVLAQLRQTPRFGFTIARELRGRYRQPVVIFTRKGTIDNAIQAYEDEEIASVIKKPDPPPSLAASVQPSDLSRLYGEALANSADDIESKIHTIIRRSKWWEKNRAIGGSFLVGVASSLVVALLFFFTL